MTDAGYTLIEAIRDRQEATRQALFRTYNDLRRQSVDSQDFELHRLTGEAYRALMRSCLTADERALLEARAEIRALRAELAAWRRGERTVGGPT